MKKWPFIEQAFRYKLATGKNVSTKTWHQTRSCKTLEST